MSLCVEISWERGYQIRGAQLNRACKEYLISEKGARCEVCGQEAIMSSRHRPPYGRRSYRTSTRYTNLEMHHRDPVRDQNYEFRLGNLKCPYGSFEEAEAYLRRWKQQMELCTLLCRPCHRTAHRPPLLQNKIVQVSENTRFQANVTDYAVA